jgi:hypothetical protein
LVLFFLGLYFNNPEENHSPSALSEAKMRISQILSAQAMHFKDKHKFASSLPELNNYLNASRLTNQKVDDVHQLNDYRIFSSINGNKNLLIIATAKKDVHNHVVGFIDNMFNEKADNTSYVLLLIN